MNSLKEIVAYCAAKCDLALSHIGRRMPIPTWFRNEIEDCVDEWADDNEVELAEDFDAEDIVLYEDEY